MPLPRWGWTMDPLELHGPDFLLLYFVLLLFATAIALLLRYALRTPADALGRIPTLDPYEIAYLSGGSSRAIEAAAASLVRRGVVSADGATRRLKKEADLPVGV